MFEGWGSDQGIGVLGWGVLGRGRAFTFSYGAAAQGDEGSFGMFRNKGSKPLSLSFQSTGSPQGTGWGCRELLLRHIESK